MIKNAVYGIITAKACGVKKPHRGHPERGRRPADRDGPEGAPGRRLRFRLGHLRPCRRRARCSGGNDVLQGTPDVLVCDSLTGNVLVKMLSAFSTGGQL